jgi:acyl-CoA synthetase (AMP-forming)/AMP-acid ligase II
MAKFFRRLALYAAQNHLAIVDPATAQSSTPEHHSYAQLLSRTSVFREALTTVAQEVHKPLEGARVGLMVPPGLDFVAAVLAIWSVRAIVGTRQHRSRRKSVRIGF